jgi:succinate dehydrogenase/fumarate reductase flavoprotein subunit
VTVPATYHEPARELPIVQEADVVVCGAGPAGVAAAIAAACAGARTCLIKVHGCLGGIWTAGQLAWVLDMEKPGLAREITQALDCRGARIGENQERYVRGARRADGICHVTFNVDIHSLDPTRDKGLSNMGVVMQPYDVPLHALIARDVDGLLLAGRCISGDFYAHASYPVTGNAVATGEAAGVLAAISALEDVLPHKVPWASVERSLYRS